MTIELEGALRPNLMMDADHPEVIAFAHTHTPGVADARKRAVKLYYAVRDGFRYDPYKVDLWVNSLSANRALDNGNGWCITKAVLLAAA